MSKTRQKFPYHFEWSKTHPHIAWIDVHNNGVAEEVAVLGIDQRNGDVYLIPITTLDSIDRNRLLNIIGKRDAAKYQLWDLMSTTVLKNGLNALEYFNQLVKVRTLSGQLLTPGGGRIGASFSTNKNISTKPQNSQVVAPPQQHVQSQAQQVEPEGNFFAQHAQEEKSVKKK